MKRIFTFFFALLSACTFSAYAEIVDGTCGDNLTWTLNTKDSTLVISGEGKMQISLFSLAPWYDYRSYIKYVTLPDGLTSIGYRAFYSCESLTSITIPNSVTSIGERAFSYCKGLTSVTIPNSVTSIGVYAFGDCFSLTSITIPNSVTSIGYRAFGGCSGLTSVTLGNSVTSIGDEAFSGCDGLTSPVYNAHCFAYMPSSYEGHYIIPDGIKQIAGGAFYSCYGLKSVTIPNSVTSIGYRAFGGCSGLTSVTLGNSVTSIGYRAFGGCSGLTSITIPNSVTSIGDEAFSGCDGLTSIIVEQGNAKYDCRENCNAIIETATNTLISGCQNTIIPNSVTSIGGYAFYGCFSLTSITIPNSVTSIGTEAFFGCESLTSVTLGNSVTSIEKGAFINSNIQEVTAYMPTPPAAAGCGLNHTSCTLYVPAEYIDTYSNTFWWEDFKEIRAIAQNEEGADKEFEVIFSDQDNNELSAQSVTLRVPVAPQIEGFTFLYWQPVAAPLDDVITIQAVYESNTPTAAPEVFVNPSNPAQKLIRNGQVYILKDDKTYTIMGAQIQ